MNWKTIITNVDIDTGEILLENELHNFIKIKKDERKTEYNECIVRLTKFYRRWEELKFE
nr:MAG: hypothetical protein [Microviridae sp.]